MGNIIQNLFGKKKLRPPPPPPRPPCGASQISKAALKKMLGNLMSAIKVAQWHDRDLRSRWDSAKKRSDELLEEAKTARSEYTTSAQAALDALAVAKTACAAAQLTDCFDPEEADDLAKADKRYTDIRLKAEGAEGCVTGLKNWLAKAENAAYPSELSMAISNALSQHSTWADILNQPGSCDCTFCPTTSNITGVISALDSAKTSQEAAVRAFEAFVGEGQALVAAVLAAASELLAIVGEVQGIDCLEGPPCYDNNVPQLSKTTLKTLLTEIL